ncbi:MAG: hypothetical protein GOV02_03790 [Candidatus Aenigmarchaeota archaeon]|nr:hypothetical protein [Candidatus Aenigmarchaeota archaeon]
MKKEDLTELQTYRFYKGHALKDGKIDTDLWIGEDTNKNLFVKVTDLIYLAKKKENEEMKKIAENNVLENENTIQR